MIGTFRSVAGRRPRVVIIGGGLAGLSAAEAIARSGAEAVVTVLESRRVTGGRAGSFLDPVSGESVDYCQHVAMGCCTNLLSLLEACGLSDAFTRSSTLSFHHPHAPTSTLAPHPWLPAPLHLLPALQSLAFLTREQRRQIRRGTWRLMRCPPERLRSVVAVDWLRAAGQSEATIAGYWDVIITSALGESCDEVSMAAARKVFVDGFLAARGASDLLVPRTSLSDLFGVRLPLVLSNLGVSILTRASVRSLRISPQSKQTERLCIELGNLDGTPLEADHVILAVPWHQVQNIVDPALAARAELAVDLWGAFPNSSISGVHLWFDRPITSEPHAVLVGTVSQWLFQRESTESSPCGHYYQVVISAAHPLRCLTHDEVVQRVVGELASVFPSAATAQLLHSRVVTDPQAVYSLRPEVDAVRPLSRTALPCLHLAGDYVQTGWPATMEGAVISGRLAANRVLRRLGGTPATICDGLPRNWLSRLLIRS